MRSRASRTTSASAASSAGGSAAAAESTGKSTSNSIQSSARITELTGDANLEEDDEDDEDDSDYSQSETGSENDDEEDDDEDEDSHEGEESDIDEIPDTEKWRLITESGLMEQVQAHDHDHHGHGHGHSHNHGGQVEEDRDYIFEGVFFSIPTTCLFIVMDILVYRQFGEPYPGAKVVSKVLKVFPAVLLLVYLTNKAKAKRWMQVSMFVTAVLSGCYFLHTMFRAPMMGIMMRAPGIITILVYCIVQLELLPAAVSLVICGLYYQFGNVKFS